MKMFYEKDTDVNLIKDKKIAIFGYGSQEFIIEFFLLFLDHRLMIKKSFF